MGILVKRLCCVLIRTTKLHKITGQAIYQTRNFLKYLKQNATNHFSEMPQITLIRLDNLSIFGYNIVVEIGVGEGKWLSSLCYAILELAERQGIDVHK